MSNYIVGIDIGASKVCGVVGDLDGIGKLQVLGITTSKCKGIKKGLLEDVESVAKAISETVKQLENIVGTTIEDAYISIPVSLCEIVEEREVLTLSSQDREIKREDIDSVINVMRLEVEASRGMEVVTINPVEYSINEVDNINNPVGLLGRTLGVRAQVLIASKEIVDNYRKAMNEAKVKVKSVIVDSLGVSKDMLKSEELTEGVALIDIGAETSDISIFKNNKLNYASSIPLGGETITSDISICLKISREDAENLKIKSGRLFKDDISPDYKLKIYSSENGELLEVDYNTLVEIVAERVKEIIVLVKRDLIKAGYYNEISSIVICGGGISLYRSVTDLVSSILDKSCRIGTPSYVGAANPIYTTATGIIKELSLNMKVIEKVEENNEPKNLNDKKSSKSVKKTFSSKIKSFLSDFF